MEEAKSEIPFSHDEYSKHEYSVFPTIRRRDKYGRVGNLVRIVVGSPGDREEAGLARIVSKERKSLRQMTDAFLLHDTEAESRKEAEKSLQSFYTNPIEPDEKLTIYWLRWVYRR